MTIFADTSALVALFRIDDPHHKTAKNIAKKLRGIDTVISNYVFLETVTVLSQRVGKEKTIKAATVIRKSFEEIRIDSEIDNLAWEIFTKQESKNVSFVDCTTFALYQKGVFDKAFTFDSDFKKNKVVVLE